MALSSINLYTIYSVSGDLPLPIGWFFACFIPSTPTPLFSSPPGNPMRYVIMTDCRDVRVERDPFDVGGGICTS